MTNEPNPRPWRVNSVTGGHISDANGDPVCFCVGSDCAKRAALIVDAVNYYKPDLHCDWRELTPEDAVAHCREVATRLGDTPCARDHLQLAAWIEERDRLRDIVRRLTEYADAVTGYRPRAVEVLSSEHPAWTFDGAALLREARAAIGEGETPTGKGVGR